MNLEPVITQIKALSPFFGGRVGGAAQYPHAVEDQVWLPRPAAYVIPLDEDADESTDLNGLQQLVRVRFGVIADLSNVADRRGYGSVLQVSDARASLFRAVLNWRPDWPGPANNAARGITYAGGSVILLDRARLHYRFDFVIETTITEEDGWQPPGDPLREIEIDVTNPATGVLTGTRFGKTLP